MREFEVREVSGPQRGDRFTLYIGKVHDRVQPAVCIQRGSVIRTLGYLKNDDAALELADAISTIGRARVDRRT